MDRLLRHVDLITRQRDRSRLDAALVTALHELLRAESVRLYKLQQSKNNTLVGLAVERAGPRICQYDDGISGLEENTPVEHDPLLSDCLKQRSPARDRDRQTGEWRHAFPVGQRRAAPLGFIGLSRRTPLKEDESATAAAIITVFDNCNDLLDYCEVDTLTGLLNRKTFDEYLFKILSRPVDEDDRIAAGQRMPQRRHPRSGVGDHWIGVMDIDHFKRINDGFGHMIGDEVLLMLANRMKAHFRAQDKLFRFGGEEFVLLLKPTELEHAHIAYERFRKAVHDQEFPQVGRVSVSIGFTRLGLSDEASAVLQNADRALYWAKEHGRNQVCCYEQLIACNALQPQITQSSDVELF